VLGEVFGEFGSQLPGMSANDVVLGRTIVLGPFENYLADMLLVQPVYVTLNGFVANIEKKVAQPGRSAELGARCYPDHHGPPFVIQV
jgi:hypothetical protein